MGLSRVVRQAGAGLRMLLLLTLLVGVAYPLGVTAAAQLVAPQRANGSRVVEGGRVVGSALVGQRFSAPGEFWSRPSAAGEDGYDALSSGASNLGPNNSELLRTVRARAADYARAHQIPPSAVPADAVTASASGLDPHISVRNAQLQAPRVARATGRPLGEIQRLVRAHTQGRTLGILGEPRVNVLELNRALRR